PGPQLGGEHPRPAADVDRPLPDGDAGEVGELRRQGPRVAAHEAVGRVFGHVEAHAKRRRATYRPGATAAGRATRSPAAFREILARDRPGRPRCRPIRWAV